MATIQISNELLAKLKQRKNNNTDSYEEIIWDLLEDCMELSKETKKHIRQSGKELWRGKTISLSEVKRKLGLQVYKR